MIPTSGSGKPTIAVESDEIEIMIAIRDVAQDVGIDAKRAQTYGIWTVCYRRYCESHEIPWLWMDSVSDFMTYLEERADVSPVERDRALDGIMFYLTDVRHIQDEADAERLEGRCPESTRSLFAQLLLRCGVPITQAIQLRVSDVDIRNSEVEIGKDETHPDRSVTVPPSVRTGLKNHLRRLRRRTDDANPLLFGHRGIPDVDRLRRVEDVGKTTKLATQVMQSFSDDNP
jgi:hypothetical protein